MGRALVKARSTCAGQPANGQSWMTLRNRASRNAEGALTDNRLDMVSKLNQQIPFALTDDAASELQLDRVRRIGTKSILVIKDRRLVDEHVLDPVGIHEAALDDAGLGIIRNPPDGAHVDLEHQAMMSHVATTARSTTS